MLLIGFGHRARQGKNTAAQAVLESCPLDTDVRMYAFADALKMEVRSACAKMGSQWALIEAWKEAGLIPDWVHYEDGKPRSLLQWWGTDYKRKKDPLYWVKKLSAKVDTHQPEIALITDVRFLNEIDFIKSRGGFTVECIRTGEPDVQVEEHKSESELDTFKGWDFYITAGTAEECRSKAIDIFRRVSIEHGRGAQAGHGQG
jgi:hypothetical protein